MKLYLYPFSPSHHRSASSKTLATSSKPYAVCSLLLSYAQNILKSTLFSNILNHYLLFSHQRKWPSLSYSKVWTERVWNTGTREETWISKMELNIMRSFVIRTLPTNIVRTVTWTGHLDHTGKISTQKVLVTKCQGKRELERARWKEYDNIKSYLTEVECGNANWINE